MYYIPRRALLLGSCIPTLTATPPSQPRESPFSTQTPPPMKLCKDCRNFVLLPGTDVKAGYCRLFGSVDMVDGTFEFSLARDVRRDACKGELYQYDSSKIDM
jgi:hypothetical protein